MLQTIPTLQRHQLLVSEIAYRIISKARNWVIRVGVSCTGKTLCEGMDGIFSCHRADRRGSSWRAGNQGGRSLGGSLGGSFIWELAKADELPVLLFWWVCITEYKLHFMLSVSFDEKANKCVIIPPQLLLTWEHKPTPYQQYFSTSDTSGGFNTLPILDFSALLGLCLGGGYKT